MPLTQEQISELKIAISEYSFPSTYFDFSRDVAVNAPDMAAVETAIGNMLVSTDPLTVKNGLANVIYWGYAQMGIRPTRVRRFYDAVTDDQISRFQSLVASKLSPTLVQIRKLKMPEYSGISFISKILMFIDPKGYCVLDLQLAGLGKGPGKKSIHDLVYTTTIGTTARNQRVYDAWRQECKEISLAYFNGDYRAVDIERGFFHLVQSKRLATAQQLYADA